MKTKSKRRTKISNRQVIGWREWVGLPEFGVERVKAKVDTGARTSAIHAWRIEPYDTDDGEWVAFELHPKQRDNQVRVQCKAPVLAKRSIRNSGGQVQLRYIITTTIELGQAIWPIELSLTTRDEMGFRMLLGRSAMRRRMIVDPSRSFLLDPVGSQDEAAKCCSPAIQANR